jgi:hypothetical protein
MRRVVAVLSIAAAVVACTTLALDDSPLVDQLPGDRGTGTEQGAAGTGLNTNLPCDVQAILENRCIACHDGSRAIPMLKYSDLARAAPSDATKTVAQIAVLRMRSTTNPMPPPPAVPPEPDEIASFESWVNAGLPRMTQSCTDPPPDVDGSVTPPPLDAGADGEAGAVCTSGTRWTMGNTPSPGMHPGMACNACHQQLGGPNLRLAGTVYATLHDPDDCEGKGPPPNLDVIVVDSNQRTYTMRVNGAGNFFDVPGGGAPPKAPFRARVTNGAQTRVMNGTVTSGDCNSCHTAQGRNGAPGRILAP